MSISTEQWWPALVGSALVGTARREPPPPPDWARPRPDAGPEVLALDAAALAGTMRRAGRPLRRADRPPAAPDDRLPAAPSRAVQLLQLVLDQPPVPASMRPMVVHAWFRAARDSGHRVPHHLIAPLLDLATTWADLRPDVREVIDARGAWLATANPDWAWALTTPAQDDLDGWQHRPTPERMAALRRIRATDPDRGRELLEPGWDRESAADRSALLAALEVGLGPADEGLLEASLDDRSDAVRRQARALLDGLPSSARAARLADLLRPLLHVSGRIRKSLTVELPTDVTDQAARDGLDRSPRGRSQRGHWLEQLAAGAPFEVWTSATGRPPRETVAMVEEEDALRGLVRAALARRDPEWAAALLEVTGDARLLDVLPTDEREQAAADMVRRAPVDLAVRVAGLLPAPWGAAFSSALVERLRSHAAGFSGPQLGPMLARGLHPDVLPQLRRWDATNHRWGDLPGDLAQYLSFVPEIVEAFR